MATFTCSKPGCVFTSSGWATEEQAAARGAEHLTEHDTGQLMTDLVEFEKSVGYERPQAAAVDADTTGEDN